MGQRKMRRGKELESNATTAGDIAKAHKNHVGRGENDGRGRPGYRGKSQGQDIDEINSKSTK